MGDIARPLGVPHKGNRLQIPFGQGGGTLLRNTSLSMINCEFIASRPEMLCAIHTVPIQDEFSTKTFPFIPAM
jgi:hypothetical protein